MPAVPVVSPKYITRSTNVTFYLNTTPTRQAAAQAACRVEGGNLATYTSMEEQVGAQAVRQMPTTLAILRTARDGPASMCSCRRRSSATLQMLATFCPGATAPTGWATSTPGCGPTSGVGLQLPAWAGMYAGGLSCVLSRPAVTTYCLVHSLLLLLPTITCAYACWPAADRNTLQSHDKGATTACAAAGPSTSSCRPT